MGNIKNAKNRRGLKRQDQNINMQEKKPESFEAKIAKIRMQAQMAKLVAANVQIS